MPTEDPAQRVFVAGLGCITHMKTKREGQEGGRRREKQKGEGIEGSRGERGEN